MKETGIEARDHTLPDLLVRSAYETYFRTNSWHYGRSVKSDHGLSLPSVVRVQLILES